MFAAATLLTSVAAYSQTYQPTKENLEARKEFTRERFGIFLHWGIYASYAQGEWYLNGGLLDSEYRKAAASFNPVNYDAKAWAKAFKEAGAEYVTITSRHHDGFSMFDTKASDYNIVKATPYGKDVLKELSDACRAEGMDMQFYYSILDWAREDYPVGRTGTKTGRKGDSQDYDSYFNFMKTQVSELLTNYGPVRALWFDGYWDHDSDATPFDWRMPEFYRYIHSVSPACLVGNNHHIKTIEGEDFQMFEKDLPGQNTTGFAPDQEVSAVLPLEMCETMNNHWGYSVSDYNYKSVPQLVRTLARCVSLNTNLLLNIGPQADGSLPEASLDRLKGIGEWMRLNERSIKGCGPGPVAEADWGLSTAPTDCGKTFFLHVFNPETKSLSIPVEGKVRIKGVTALADGSALQYTFKKGILDIGLPELPAPSCDLDPNGADYVIEVILK